MQTKERNIGMDFLRLLAMFMVIILHIMGRGGLLASTKENDLFYYTSWSFETLCYCAVNCFAMITGFFLYKSRFKLSRILNLWFEVLFYSVVISLIFFFTCPETFTTENIINAIFPVTRRQYWYISSYFGLCLFIPFLNAGIEKISKESLKKILILFFIFISIFPTFLRKDPFLLGLGYGTLWLIIMYILGAYIGKYEVLKNLNKWLSLLLFFASCFVAVFFKYLIEKQEFFLFYKEKSDFLIDYVSPMIILSAIFLFLFCLKIKFNNLFGKIIVFLSPSALAIYLIHVEPLFWDRIVKDFAIKKTEIFGMSLQIYPIESYSLFIMKILATAVSSFFIFLTIDLFRRLLFKIFGINSLSKKIENIFIKE